MINITVGNIKEELHAHINDIMSDFQTIEGISCRIERVFYRRIEKWQ